MHQTHSERGAILFVLFAMLVPLLLIVGAFTAAMSRRSAEGQAILDQEKALLAAESGIDDAIFRGRSGPKALQTGVTYTRGLGGGISFDVTPTYLGSDGQDNDADGSVDEADEDAFQVLVAGTYRNTTRKVVAYLGPVPLLPSISSAVMFLNSSIVFAGSGTPKVSGNEVTMTGASTGTTVTGVTVASPGPSTSFSTSLSGYVTGSPTMATATTSFNFTEMVTSLQNIANLILTSKRYSNYKFGSGTGGVANIAYRNGDVQFSGSCQGAGILLVTGDLTVTGNFVFDGVVIVLGDIVNSAGTATIRGALLQGPSGSTFEIKGTLNVIYSSAAIALANKASGTYVAFNGWQEIAR